MDADDFAHGPLNSLTVCCPSARKLLFLAEYYHQDAQDAWHGWVDDGDNTPTSKYPP